jgi:DNA-binding transcriptional LysR family regulator
LSAGKHFDPRTTQRNFRIGSGDFMSTLVAGTLLNTFEREAPNASFTFRSLLGQHALEALRRDEIDVAVGRFSTLTEDIVAEHLYDDGYCIVARDPHPAVHGSIDLDTFSQSSHVIISLGGELTQLGDDTLRHLNIERRIVAAVPRFLTAFTLIAQSNAILTVQRRLAARYRREFRLQLVPPPFKTKPFSIVALRPTRSRNDPAIEWLIARIRESAAVE